MTGVRRGVVRLIVPSADRRRVLAAPNGLAGWRLPSFSVELPFTGWDDGALARAAGAVNAHVVPERAVTPDCWAVTVDGRVPAVGRTWVGLDEVDRLGADASAVRTWAESGSGVSPPPDAPPG